MRTTVNNAKWWRKTGKDKFEEFNSWLGDVNVISRTTVRDHVMSQDHESLLDVACATAIDYQGYKDAEYGVKYYGLDLTKEFLDRAHDDVFKMVGSIERIPIDDKLMRFDVVVARAILEHLDYYEVAVKECIRVAAKEFIVVFYKQPGEKDIIRKCPEGYYDNTYSKKKFAAFVLSQKRVRSIEWVEVDDPVECNTIAYIRLNNG